MGALQIVFADNPQPAHKSKKNLQSQDKSSTIKRKVGSRMKPSPKQLRARKKFAAMARKRAKMAKAKNKAKSKKKNPYQFITYKKGKKGSTKRSSHFPTSKELRSAKKVVARKSIVKAIKGSKLDKFRKSAARVVKDAARARKQAIAFARKKKKAGYSLKKIYISPGSALASAAKAAKRKKRKGGKRKQTRKGSVMAKRRKKKSKAYKYPRRKKATRRKAKRRGKGRVIVLKRKNQKVTIKRNPTIKAMVEQYSGFQVEELGSLLVGGAIYGTVDGLAARYAPGIYAMAAKVPVVGTTVVPALIGAAMNYAGKQFKVKALSMVGEGLVGAAVVAMGIQASQYIPGIAPAVAGLGNVDFTPGRGVLMGYPRDGADFGNVDYTPGPGVLMGQGPAQLGMEAQMGLVPEGLSGYARDGADFGLVPEGLGSLG